jgi:hypothetical protein
MQVLRAIALHVMGIILVCGNTFPEYLLGFGIFGFLGYVLSLGAAGNSGRLIREFDLSVDQYKMRESVIANVCMLLACVLLLLYTLQTQFKVVANGSAENVLVSLLGLVIGAGAAASLVVIDKSQFTGHVR